MVVREMYTQIKPLVVNHAVEVILGEGFLELKPMKLKKQRLIKQLLEKASENHKVDCLVYLGDKNNEAVFEFIEQRKCQQKFLSENCAIFTCVKGR
mmetsp:Transcript_5000/g.3637  ORF Transcript_5000/g.3637 Transcript_5000/m.3637 type:complete len:96 (+) Transcript_5000:2812-3099(+)